MSNNTILRWLLISSTLFVLFITVSPQHVFFLVFTAMWLGGASTLACHVIMLFTRSSIKLQELPLPQHLLINVGGIAIPGWLLVNRASENGPELLFMLMLIGPALGYAAVGLWHSVRT